MNSLKIKLIGAALLFASSTAFAQSAYYEINGVPNASSLILRAWPSSSSQPINNIPHDAIKIETTGKDIFKENKKWLQVIYQNSVGWVEADYLAQMQVPALQPTDATTAVQSATINSPAAFNCSQQIVTVSKEPTLKAITWTPEEDTIYHDPTLKQIDTSNQIEKAKATHTLVAPNNQGTDGDLRGENLTGNRYENIKASMSVQFMSNLAIPAQ